MNLSNRDLIRVFSVATIFVAALYFIYLILPIVGLLFASLVLAVILNPMANKIQRFMPKKNRSLAVIITMITIIFIIGAILTVVARPFVSQFGDLVESVNESIESVDNNYSLTSSTVSENVATALDGNVAGLAQKTISVIGASFQSLLAALSSFFFYLFMTTTLVFFMLFDSQRVIDSIGKLVPKKHQHLYKKLSTNLFDIVSRYFGGTLIVALLAGIFTFIILSILGIPYAVPLAILVALFGLIPMIGATLGGFLVIVATLLTGDVNDAIIIAVYLVIYQQVENSLVTPLIQKRTVKMSPLAILVALLIGGAVGGFAGSILAIPIAAFIKATYNILQEEGYIKQA